MSSHGCKTFLLIHYHVLLQVIYALNTKNDEHDAIVQQIKDQHEEEVQKLLQETKQKIETYKAKLDAESQHNSRIQQLEQSLHRNEVVREQHLSQFESFKRTAEDRETKLKSQHAEKMLELSHEVLKTKKDFEEKLKQFELWKDGVNDEHERKISELKNAHQKEISDIRNMSKDQSNDWLNELKKVEDKFQSEIEGLQCKNKDIEESKNVLVDEYEAKLAKAQLFYEKELEAVMKMNNISQDEANQMLMKEKEKMKKDFALREAELQKQIDSALLQLTDKEDEVDKMKIELEKLNQALQAKQGSEGDLSKQVSVTNNCI